MSAEVNAEVNAEYRSGFVALAGRANVGKSTLLNQLVGQKLSIVTRKPHTTRHRIAGILTRPEAQLVFVDTPGLHDNPERALNDHMNRATTDAVHDADLVVLVVEAGRWTDQDEAVLEQVRAGSAPVALAVNKVDRVKPRDKLLPYLEQAAGRHDFAFVVPIAARKGENLHPLEREIAAWLPQGPALFPDEQVSDRSERFLAAEILREKLTERLHQELPYALTVGVETFERSSGGVSIGAVVWVERASQKAIVIGRSGRQLKAAGRAARLALKHELGEPVHLEVWVRVLPGWPDDEGQLRALGYE